MARMGLDVSVDISYGDRELIGELWNCDTVVIGGGPLMDIPQLKMLARVMERAHSRGCRTAVEGCGIGPIEWPETRDSIRRIMAVADEVRLRDHGSASLLHAIGIERPADVVDDPGRRWVTSTGIRHRGTATGPICVFARELTSGYPQMTSPDAATATIASFLQDLCDWFPRSQVRLHAMHHFPVGGDDRRYSRRLKTMVNRQSCSVDEVPRMPLEETLTSSLMQHL